MAAEGTIVTCLICKHDLVIKVNIFKIRTNISKTLLSSKLSTIVQDSFSQDMESQDICTSCSSLLNHVDECESKLMALENEVKLKYKVPFAIEVKDRLCEKPVPKLPPSEEPLPTQLPSSEVPAVGRVDLEIPEEIAVSPNHQPRLVTMPDGSGLGTTVIVVQTSQADADGNVVIYRSASDVESESELRPTSKPERNSGDPNPGSSASPVDSGKSGAKDGLTCNLCNKKYASAKCLRAHMASHASTRKKKHSSCGFCPQTFTNHMLLHKHWNREHPLKLLPCPFCEQRFANKSCLRRHMVIHEEPRFNCGHCGRPFHSPGDLRKHMLIKHTDVKNFQCPQCPLKFKMNWMLVRHQVRKHNQDSRE